MKTNIIYILSAMLLVLSFQSCEKDDDASSGGTPEVRYVRPCDVDASDSLLVSAYLGSTIAIIGENLGGVNKIYFNDQKASLNPNYVTSTAIIVTIPSSVPSEKEDLIKLYTNNDSCFYSFETNVPAPTVSSMTCEYVNDGDTAHIEGLYFIDDTSSPLTVTFPGEVEGTIVDFDETSMDVIVPEGSESGTITISTVYGEGESTFEFRDDRNTILDFDTLYPDGSYYHGWHGGNGYSSDNGVDNQYLIFQGTSEDESWMTDSKWDDSNYGYERWTYTADDDDFFDVGNIEDYELKFEVNIPAEWSAAALQIIFTGAEDVMMNWQDGNGVTYNSSYTAANGYVSDDTYPRALWIPWADEDDASYTTDGWITVSIEMSDFKYNADGEEVTMKGAGHYSGITLFVNGGGVTGTDCNPIFYIDNVRVVPID